MDQNQLEEYSLMDRKQIEDLQSNNVCKSSNASQVSNNTRLTPGKFPDMSETDNIDSTKDEFDNETDNMNNFYLYSTNIDTNAIWYTNKDLKRSYSLPSQSLYTNKSEAKESVNSIWNSTYNSNESLPSEDDNTRTYKMTEISIDINDFQDIDTDHSKVAKDNENLSVIKEIKENYTSEESKKIVSMINSHDGWGVKPVNQKTPWQIPDADNNNNNDNFQNNFSNWSNEAPNGVCVWDAYETAKKQSVSDWSNTAKGKSNVNYAMTQPKTVWSTVANDSIWSGSGQYTTNSGVIGPSKMNVGAASLYNAESNISYPPTSRLPVSRVQNEPIKNGGWSSDINRVPVDFKGISSSYSVDRSVVPRSKHMDNEISNLKLLKDAQKQLLEQLQKDVRKIQEIDNNLAALSKLSDVQSRPILTELLRQRQTIQQRTQNSHNQLDAISQRVMQIEDALNNYGRATYGSSTPVENKHSINNLLAAKMETMKLQQSIDFRPDVPEFVPGKKWYGLLQNGKENQNPTISNGKMGSCDGNIECQEISSYSAWLLIQNLPSHISIEMIQSFFLQNNNPYVSPIHSNPFSRWVLVKFPNQFSSQKAFHLLSGKVGQVSLISDQEANIKLQELKRVMARFVAH